MAVLREVIYLCCIAIAVVCGIAAVTIAVAIVSGKLPDPQAWMAVVFFVATGVAFLIAGRAARISNE
jgi:hypothetical protein